MFDIGFPELVLIMVIALLVFGPGKMAEIGRQLGKGVGDFRRATADVTKEFNDALKLDEPAKPVPAPAPVATPVYAPPPAAQPAPSEAAKDASGAPPAASAEEVAANAPAGEMAPAEPVEPAATAEPPQAGVVADEPGAS
ncbi:MAG: twin-arginine translocase TatA/TatE family subunit [Chloroflexota bacterium]|nr:twin-arginine translocase TatA/TatE family subunit [Chloroflexota bacterium]